MHTYIHNHKYISYLIYSTLRSIFSSSFQFPSIIQLHVWDIVWWRVSYDQMSNKPYQRFLSDLLCCNSHWWDTILNHIHSLGIIIGCEFLDVLTHLLFLSIDNVRQYSLLNEKTMLYWSPNKIKWTIKEFRTVTYIEEKWRIQYNWLPHYQII